MLPKCNITETLDSYKYCVEAPFVSFQDITIDVSERYMTISLQKRVKTYGKVLKKEINNGLYNRSFLLPRSCFPNEMRGSLKDGILEIILPKVSLCLPLIIVEDVDYKENKIITL